ncbi:putative bifunctional diguanylate cyclase/phosphodiesterase [Methylobacterium gossipiicola]|uniref:PAS domain S-box-containing protein/diguanylate cyclase (GGDEF) domain-containing protein n=1 Tax=Methylobacterium gossipiicola TaxID=582675 RepID=A0A1I2SC17_9HYPH|nr:EAL domain-containing protein [Methylobacterium gossipiicola]SFG49269.1 PAS domain S-box-containing protein/diguanylate cyclase (GGDEF) domain-containing protein [Methylobacterium gossipiicola]
MVQTIGDPLAREQDRLAALRRLCILESSPEPHLDAVCRLAADLFEIPMALVLLVDEARVWFKARCGVEEVGIDRKGTFCDLTIQGAVDTPLVILDLAVDPRSATSPLVLGPPHARFYAGIPLALESGLNLGTFCIMDRAPRPDFTDAQRRQLGDLGLIVQAHLRLHEARIAIETDATRRRVTEEALRESEQRFRLLAETTTDVIIWSGLDTTRLYVSPSIQTVLGFGPDELVGTKPLDFVHPDDVEVFARVLDDLTDGRIEQASTCQRYRRKDGSWVFMDVCQSLARDPATGEPAGYVTSLRDITARKADERRIAHLALHDPLTDLPNRTLFWERLAAEIRVAGETDTGVAVLTCDLDRFKQINDSLGHPAGDHLLQVVAARLLAVVRETDTVARLGGDEFAVILGRIDNAEDAACLARRMIEAINRPIAFGGHPMKVGASIGIAIAGGGALDALALVKRSDAALYRAKAAGRNTYRLGDSEADAAAESSGLLVAEMKGAMKRGDFLLNYQPIIDLATGGIAGFEALVRWRHPCKGELSPSAFIPLAEESGLIVPLGAWVLKEACREAAAWPEPLRIAVNVSAIQFQQISMEETVRHALATSGLAPHRLELEITETMLMQKSDTVCRTMERLRSLGVRIALDDFGTGYSSLSYLHQFSFDTIKIDRSFVAGSENPKTVAITRAIVALGTSFGARVIAEGVETEEHLAFVRTAGCTDVQGFLFDPPLPAEAIVPLIESGRLRLAA